MKAVCTALSIVIAMVSLLGCTASQMKVSRQIQGIAYKFNPIAGAGMELFNLLATSVSSVPADVLGASRDYQPCAFSMKELRGWQRVSEPMGVERVPSAQQTLWYQNGDAFMQVLCIPKSVTMEQWGQATLNALPPAFASFELLGQASFQFWGAPAHWFAFKTVPKGFTQQQRQYMVLIDRGQTGLIISLAMPADQYDRLAPIFRAAVDSIQLH